MAQTKVTADVLADTLDLSGKTLTMPTGLVPWTYGSIVNTTSGTALDLITGLADTYRDIEILLSSVSTNTANQPPIIQLGTAGGYETSSYLGEIGFILDANCNETAVTDGFYASRSTNYAAADLITGVIRLTRWDTSLHQWFASGLPFAEGTSVHPMSGVKTTSQAMTKIRLTTPGGTATFDAGSARVRYR